MGNPVEKADRFLQHQHQHHLEGVLRVFLTPTAATAPTQLLILLVAMGAAQAALD
jgi:hypothetical protein